MGTRCVGCASVAFVVSAFFFYIFFVRIDSSWIVTGSYLTGKGFSLICTSLSFVPKGTRPIFLIFLRTRRTCIQILLLLGMRFLRDGISPNLPFVSLYTILRQGRFLRRNLRIGLFIIYITIIHMKCMKGRL